MKKILIGISILIILIIGGGYYVTHFIGAGVVGRIQYFEFNIPVLQLEKKMDMVIQLNEEIEKVNSDDYYKILTDKNQKSDNPLNEDFKSYYAKFSYLSITDDGDKYIFRYKRHDEDSTSQITLVSAGEYGNGLDLAKNIGYLAKRKYRNIFEEKLINKIKIEVTTK